MTCKAFFVDWKSFLTSSPAGNSKIKVACQPFFGEPSPSDMADISTTDEARNYSNCQPCMLVDFLQPAFKILQMSGFFPYRLQEQQLQDSGTSAVHTRKRAPGTRKLVLSIPMLIAGIAFGLSMAAVHVYGLMHYLGGLQRLIAKLPKSGLVCIWVGVLVPSINAAVSVSAICFSRNRAIKELLSQKFPETDKGVVMKYHPKPHKLNLFLKQIKKYVIIQLIGSVFILIAYGCLGKYRSGYWIDGLHGFSYSISYFILFGFIDTFQHTFLYAVQLMTMDLKAEIKELALESESESSEVQADFLALVEPIHIRMRKLRKRHLILVQLPNKLAEAMAPVPFLDSIAFGVIVTTQVFVAILIFDLEGLEEFVWDAAALAFNSVICIGRLIHTCFLTASLEDEFKSLKPELCSLQPGNLPHEVTSEALAFIQQAAVLEPSFSASGFFTLNKSAITGALSTVATYLIIFGEFHVNEMELTSSSSSSANSKG